MALKDLPGSTVLDFKILLDQLNTYITAVGKERAGPKPTGSPIIDGRRVSKADWTLGFSPVSYKSVQLAQSQMTSLYDSLKGSITVQASDKATFDSTFKDTATWSNNFFIIRTQVVGAVASGDPILKAFDDLWNNLGTIRPSWRGGK
jgi:hypothetical protein